MPRRLSGLSRPAIAITIRSKDSRSCSWTTPRAWRKLEVKTTGLGKFFPFYVTNNEVRCSEDIPQQYHLFRVFDFGREPRLYILHGSLRDLCQLDPVLYRAVI